jgi:hypothetical protein
LDRFDLTLGAKIAVAIRTAVLNLAAASLFGFFILTVYRYPPAEVDWRVYLVYVYFGVPIIVLLIRIVTNNLKIFQGSLSIAIGQDWIELPRLGRVDISEIRAIKTRYSPFHRRFVIVRKRKKGLLFHDKYTVHPHRFGMNSGIGGRIEQLAAQLPDE